MVLRGMGNQYFTEFTISKFFLYILVLIYVISSCMVFILEPFIALPEECYLSNNGYNQTMEKMPNPLYDGNPCRTVRYARLLFLNQIECSFGRRLVASVILGGVVGWERRQSDRPAGIRTMALASLGSCLFTITSSFNFLDGPMGWDASRIAAAIPSGVGFLGAGLIFKDSQQNKKTGYTSHVVHGLTTSASLWISAAVGVACAGELYFCATFSVALILTLLRFGPRQPHTDDDEEYHGKPEYADKEDEELGVISDQGGNYLSTAFSNNYNNSNNKSTIMEKQPSNRSIPTSITESERGRLLGHPIPRPRASLGGVM